MHLYALSIISTRASCPLNATATGGPRLGLVRAVLDDGRDARARHSHPIANGQCTRVTLLGIGTIVDAPPVQIVCAMFCHPIKRCMNTRMTSVFNRVVPQLNAQAFIFRNAFVPQVGWYLGKLSKFEVSATSDTAVPLVFKSDFADSRQNGTSSLHLSPSLWPWSPPYGCSLCSI